MKELSGLFRCLGDETRLRIFCLLMNEDLCVCELQEILGLTQSRVSQHLGILRGAGMVTVQKKGQWALYRVNREAFARTSDAVKQMFANPPWTLTRMDEARQKLDDMRSQGLKREDLCERHGTNIRPLF